MDKNDLAEVRAAVSDGFNLRADREAVRQEAIARVKAAFDIIKENAAPGKYEPAFDYEEITDGTVKFVISASKKDITPRENFTLLKTTAGVCALFYTGGAVDVVYSCSGGEADRRYGDREFRILDVNQIEKIARLEPHHVIGIAKKTANRAVLYDQVKVPETRQAAPANAVLRKN